MLRFASCQQSTFLGQRPCQPASSFRTSLPIHRELQPRNRGCSPTWSIRGATVRCWKVEDRRLCIDKRICYLSKGLFLHDPGRPGWPAYRDQFRLIWVQTRNFSPVYEMRKGRRSSARVVARDSRNNANMKYKGTTFVPIIALATLMQLNRMLMMWKIQQAK